MKLLSMLAESGVRIDDVWDLKYLSDNRSIVGGLHQLGARPVQVGTATVWLVGEQVVEVDDGDASVEDLSTWLFKIDPESFFPTAESGFNDEFWKYPQTLYHATDDSNIKGILRTGLGAASRTRGLTNRSVGAAVFTTTEYDELVLGSYGDAIFEILTSTMAKDGYTPRVSQEPDVLQSRLRNDIGRRFGEDHVSDPEVGMSENTIIVYGSIPPKYLRLL